MKMIKNGRVLVLCILILFTVLAATAGAANDQDLLDILDHIAEDIEEIHEDMHVVAFSLRVLSYSSVGIFLVLLGQLAVLLKKK